MFFFCGYSVEKERKQPLSHKIPTQKGLNQLSPYCICEDVKERPCDAPHPPQPRQKNAPSIRVFLPLRS
ncbi:MAG: hypothetical protein IIW17_03630, partial [Clostridia bacterium]|nr:hypothetical protein [Clostridia bacterium]